MWRKLGMLGVLLTVLQSVVDLTDRDGAVGTAAEIALLASVFGGGASAVKPGDDRGGAADPLSALSR